MRIARNITTIGSTCEDRLPSGAGWRRRALSARCAGLRALQM